jgi:hypothetical protein
MDSKAETESLAFQRAKFIQEHYQTDIIFEEFIEGREIYVGALGGVETDWG